MSGSIVTKPIRDGAGNLMQIQCWDLSGTGAGPFVPLQFLSSASGLGVVDFEALSATQVAAINAITSTIDDGVPITAAALPLPAGAALEAGGNLAAINTKLGTALPLPVGAAADASLGGANADAAADTGASTTNGFLRWLRDKFVAGITLAASSAVIGKVGIQIGGADVAAANPIPVSSAPGTLTYGQIVMTGSAVQLPSRALVNGLVIKARDTNAGNGFVGASGVTATDNGTGNGYRLSPGDAWSGTPTNANQVYVIGTAGDVFYFTGS
ncbi:hypothetical protein SAMN02745157_1544 [Kaistia soli DSM 19436]|uniref:Uncharacterized protein n=1 Tax=Kaistia soli DSM 19436 TaxID=1122133 RepID=A0A1M4YK62_9HYPH|nr:hypothetical protein [Kaistia soli]SHF06120.1 hypothetical protein SAMN02745157_1544 [Kaistia soli DSM 19436]